MEFFSSILWHVIGKLSWVAGEISNPHLHNYFYWLVGISLFCWGAEWLFPWRKNQGIIREDFWMDVFYMFFNFFIIYIIGFGAAAEGLEGLFNRLLQMMGIKNLAILTADSLPYWAHLSILFVIKDLIQYFIHRLLHKVPFLWEFHKVHHSVKEMGFAAHLRYHWMENAVYKVLQYIPLAMLGYGLTDFFVADILALAIGHLNHSNLKLPLGYLKYLLNHPQMHLWHHAKEIPSKTGINFGLSLSCWDYLFGTVYYPEPNPEMELGFDGDEKFPKDFVTQNLYPLKGKE